MAPQHRRSFGRLTLPTVPMAEVADMQGLLSIPADKPLLDAVEIMLQAGKEMAAVTRPGDGKDECVGMLTEHHLMKVRPAPQAPLKQRRRVPALGL